MNNGLPLILQFLIFVKFSLVEICNTKPAWTSWSLPFSYCGGTYSVDSKGGTASDLYRRWLVGVSSGSEKVAVFFIDHDNTGTPISPKDSDGLYG